MHFADRSDFYYPQAAIHVLASKDGGLTWQFTGKPWPFQKITQSTLPDGTIVETGSHCYVDMDRWERYPSERIPELKEKGYYVKDMTNKGGYAALIYDLWMRRSTDGGKTWIAKPIYKQFGFLSYLVSRHYQQLLDDGTIVAFCSGRPTADGPRNAYIARSEDKGDTWQFVMLADGRLSPVRGGSHVGFHETFPIVYPDGRMFVMIRTQLGDDAYFVTSDDGGKTWSKPHRSPIRAKHPVPALLRDGTIVVTYPRRWARPYGIRARFTSDRGKTWSDEVVIRDNFEIENGLAHPVTVEMSDGTLFTVMQGDKVVDDGKVQHFIFGSRWSRDYRNNVPPKLPEPPVRPKFNYDRVDKSPWPDAEIVP